MNSAFCQKMVSMKTAPPFTLTYPEFHFETESRVNCLTGIGQHKGYHVLHQSGEILTKTVNNLLLLPIGQTGF